MIADNTMNCFKIIALTGVSVVLALAAAEGLSRKVMPIAYGQKFYAADGKTPVPMFQDDVTLTPSLSFRQITQEFDVPTTHTARGFRGPAGGFMDSSNPDVVFIGDSMTYGIGLSDTQTIPYLYCQTLKLHCLNLGRPGASTFSAVRVLEHFLSAYDLHPRKVNVIMNVMTTALFGGNDLMDNLNDQPAPAAPKASASMATTKAQAPSDVRQIWTSLIEKRGAVLVHSNLARVVYYKAAPVLRQKLNPALAGEQKKAALAATQAALKELDALAKAKGFEYTIYLVHPMQDLVRGTYAQTLKDIVSIAPKGRVVPTAEALLDQNPVDDYYPLDGHLKPEGAKKVANLLTGNR